MRPGAGLVAGGSDDQHPAGLVRIEPVDGFDDCFHADRLQDGTGSSRFQSQTAPPNALTSRFGYVGIVSARNEAGDGAGGRHVGGQPGCGR